MTKVLCFCGISFFYEGEIGVCPNCYEYVTNMRTTPREAQEMQEDLDLLFTMVEYGLLDEA